jgi:uncharacterized protein
MPRNRLRATILVAALIGWNGSVAPRLPDRWLVPIHAVLATLLVGWTRAPLGMRSPARGRGTRWGLAAASAVSSAVAASAALPPIRVGMAARELPAPVAAWLLVRIPVGTIWPEEAAFRGALGTVAAQAFGDRWGRVLQAAAFGLSHVADARGADEPVAGTVLVTGAAGWAFGWLYDRSGSLVAPMLVHLAINEAGALTALAVRAQTSRTSTSSR